MIISLKSAILLVAAIAILLTGDVLHAEQSRGVSEHVTIDLAFAHAAQGVQVFYKVYGRWPATWREVSDKGIIQVPLLSPGGQTVDPDDRRLDFDRDFTYIPAQRDGLPRIHYYNQSAPPTVTVLKAPMTYAELFAAIDKRRQAGMTALASSEPRLLQFGMASILAEDMARYRHLNKRYPASFKELIDSGVSAYTWDSVNPLTGRPIAGDGTANDFAYKLTGNNQPVILPMDSDGKVRWHMSF